MNFAEECCGLYSWLGIVLVLLLLFLTCSFFFFFFYFAVELLQCLNTVITYTKFSFWKMVMVMQQARAFQASSFHPDLNNFAFNEAVLLAQPRIGYGATDCLYAVGEDCFSGAVFFFPFFLPAMRPSSVFCLFFSHQFYTVDFSHYGFCAEKALY